MNDKISSFLKKINCNYLFRFLSSWLLTYLIFSIKYGLSSNLSGSNAINLFVFLLFIVISFLIITILNRFLKKNNLDYYLFLIICFIFGVLLAFTGKSLYFILTLFPFVLLIFKPLAKSNNELIIYDNYTKFVCIFLGFLMFLIISISGIFRYKIFNAPNFDLGLETQNFYYLKKSFVPLSTAERDMLLNHFVVHISPIYYLALPLYLIFSNAMTLQVVSALLISSALIPIYLICKNKKMSNLYTLIICMIYSVSLVAISSVFYDFHENHFLIPLLFWLIYAYASDKKKLYYLFLFLVLFVKEDAFIYTFVFGLFSLFDSKNKKRAIYTMLISLLYFGIAYEILKVFGEGVMSSRFENLIYEDSGLLGIIKTLITNPYFVLRQIIDTNISTKFKYIIALFLPFTFVPLFCKKYHYYLLFIPMFLNLISSYLYLCDINFHYNCGVYVFVFYLFICNIKYFKKNILFSSLLLSVMCFVALPFIHILENVIYYYDNKNSLVEIDNLLKTIPDDASVSATTFYIAHLANRDEIYEVFYHENALDIDYVVIDVDNPENEAIFNYYKQNGYSIFNDFNNYLYILKKNDS